ncbi:DUF4333 domain-containing protein, partial [Mycobacterium avium subsp. hominissuis]|nr:DUF4333 domain-containing protein [Mycobacterium avium subsp. hominissuis]
TAAAFSSALYRRVVGFPGDCSFGIPASSFPRSGASGISRAFHISKGATFTCEFTVGGHKLQAKMTFLDSAGTYSVGRPQ